MPPAPKTTTKNKSTLDHFCPANCGDPSSALCLLFLDLAPGVTLHVSVIMTSWTTQKNARPGVTVMTNTNRQVREAKQWILGPRQSAGVSPVGVLGYPSACDVSCSSLGGRCVSSLGGSMCVVGGGSVRGGSMCTVASEVGQCISLDVFSRKRNQQVAVSDF